MKAIILAAGVGGRLGELANNTPKCLIKIGEKTILERTLDILLNNGIKKEDIIIVIGGKGEVWNEENENKIKILHSNVIINNENIEKNQAYSFWLGVKEINESILCLDGDTLFHNKVIELLIRSEYPSAFLTRKAQPSEGRRRVLIENDRVFGIGKEINSDRVYIPILKFDKIFLSLLKKELESQPEIYFNNSIEVTVNNICKENSIYNINLEYGNENIKNLIVNINTPEEYYQAQDIFGKSKNFVAIMFGYTAVGKSSTAKKLAKIPNTDIYHSAIIRKELNLTPKTLEEADKFFDYRNNLRNDVDKIVYTKLAQNAEKSLSQGRNVVLDAGYFFQWQRQLVYDKIKQLDPDIFIIKVICEDENEILRRIEDRKKSFGNNPLAETPSWNTYLATKEITESAELDLKENSVNIFEYDNMENKLKTSKYNNSNVNKIKIFIENDLYSR